MSEANLLFDYCLLQSLLFSVVFLKFHIDAVTPLTIDSEPD